MTKNLTNPEDTLKYEPAALGPVASWIAWKLEGAAQAALTPDELMGEYRHTPEADVWRVCERLRREGKPHKEVDGLRAIIERVANELVSENPKKIVREFMGDEPRYRPLDGYAIGKLRYGKQKVHPPVFSVLGDPFNPMSGVFSDNIRISLKGDDTELRESMREFGWIEHFPAIQDQRGITLVGNRRLKIAEELGIKPVIVKVNLGLGDEGDVERFKLSIASNIGWRNLTVADKKRIAVRLYKDANWSIKLIAQTLGVKNQSVEQYLEDTPRRVRSTGNINVKSIGGHVRLTPELKEAIKREVRGGATYREAARKYGVAPNTVTRIVHNDRVNGTSQKDSEGFTSSAPAPEPRPPEPEPSPPLGALQVPNPEEIAGEILRMLRPFDEALKRTVLEILVAHIPLLAPLGSGGGL